MRNNISNSDTNLYYIHDPMCSWCWAFRPVRDQVFEAVKKQVKIHYILGGLAPDSDLIMSADMQVSIRSNWQRIQQEIPETEFNYDFWTQCQPRRSTYPACRAIIAARMQQPEPDQTTIETDMLLAIQRAYYLEAKNPSDYSTLSTLAAEIGLDREKFMVDIKSERCQKNLMQEISFCRELGVHSFPSLVLIKQDQDANLLHLDYNNSASIIEQILGERVVSK